MRLFLRFSSLALLLASLGCASASGDPQNTILAEIAPPGGVMKAVIFERTGGPGGAPTTQVSIIALEDALPFGPGNVFISDASSAPGRGIKVKWTGPSALSIAYPEATGVYRNEPGHEGVSITYEVFTPAPAAAAPSKEPATPGPGIESGKAPSPASTDAEGSPADAEPGPEPIELPPPPGSSAPEPPSPE